MATDAVEVTALGQRCSAWARSVQLQPGGTAGTPTGFVLVDWPLPWPGDVGDIEELQPLGARARAEGLRVQLTVRPTGLPGRVALYRRPPRSGFVAYGADAAEVELGSGSAALAALQRLLALEVTDAPGPGEILVCTHGRRDVCCGSLGTTLAEAVSTAQSPAGGTGGRTVRRTSHTGGHRFAPTVFLFPEGTGWAFADVDLIDRLTARQGPLDDVVARYRGCAGLADPRTQVLERAVLAEVGWPLFALARRGEHLAGDRIRLTVTAADALLGAGAEGPPISVWEAEVVVGRRLPVPDCGKPLAEARKLESELVVHGVERVG